MNVSVEERQAVEIAPGDPPVVSFLVPARNAARWLPALIGSIRAADYPRDRVEIVVADNGSSDRTREVAEEVGAVVVGAQGLRVAAVRNLAASRARGDVLAFVDADHVIGPGWLQAATASLRGPDVGAVGALCHAPAGGTWVQRAYDCLRPHREGARDVEWLGSGNLAMRRSVFQSIGGFDERFETCEDVDLCRRLKKSGYRVLADHRLVNVHHGDPSTLRALFLGELWRGRGNLHVSLRAPWEWRNLAGMLPPLLGLLLIATTLAGAVLWPWTGAGVLAVGLAGLALLAASRAILMIRRGRVRRPTEWAQCLVVAATYEVARTLAVIAGVTHDTRARVG